MIILSTLSSVLMMAWGVFQSDKSVTPIGTYSYEQVRKELLEKREIALLDVREEGPFASGHPLFAANLPLSRLELEAYTRIPRQTTTIVVYDNGEGLAQIAAERLLKLGYTQVNLLTGGLNGWKEAGGEIFIDVNAPSKAFGEYVEHQRHTPSLSAQEVKSLLDAKANVVVVDVRRFDEYNTMSIPSSTSVPGAELVLRIRELAPDPNTKVIVNCAGRTRSIIGTQSLVNAGIPNQVAALRNGTMGWTLVGQELDHGQTRKFHDVSPEIKAQAIVDSRRVADHAGVKRITRAGLQNLLNDTLRSTYRIDVRTAEEFESGHLPGFVSFPGGQLVQETDHIAAVRGARIVLVDDYFVRANMSASWLAQMAWEVYVLDEVTSSDFTEKGPALLSYPSLPLKEEDYISATSLAALLESKENNNTVVVDLALNAQYVKRRIPGSWYLLRSQLKESIQKLPASKRYVLTSSDGRLAAYALQEFRMHTRANVLVLNGGTNAWTNETLKLASGDDGTLHYASTPIDRYRRPYEGTNSTPEAMQAYFDWEYGLVDQLKKDGTHGFFVIE